VGVVARSPLSQVSISKYLKTVEEQVKRKSSISTIIVDKDYQKTKFLEYISTLTLFGTGV
jgi:hypothetical protein